MPTNGRKRIRNSAAKLAVLWQEEGWPPDVGMKVKLWKPAEDRGRLAKVVASDAEALKGYKLAPEGKVRVLFAGSAMSVAMQEVFPAGYKLKDVENIEA